MNYRGDQEPCTKICRSVAGEQRLQEAFRPDGLEDETTSLLGGTGSAGNKSFHSNEAQEEALRGEGQRDCYERNVAVGWDSEPKRPGSFGQSRETIAENPDEVREEAKGRSSELVASTTETENNKFDSRLESLELADGHREFCRGDEHKRREGAERNSEAKQAQLDSQSL